jgi:hypothetical protein
MMHGKRRPPCNALPVPFLDPVDASKAVGYLAGEDGRHITSTAQFIDQGELNPPKPRAELTPLNTLSINGSHSTQIWTAR